MTALLESPVGVLDVTRLEQCQPDVPLVCTRGQQLDDSEPDPCQRVAHWEAMCFGCTYVFRRCEFHHLEDIEAAAMGAGLPDVIPGQCHLCAICDAPVAIQQYVRISA